MVPGITDEEMSMLNALAQRYAASGQDYNSLTEQEWKFVTDIGTKIAQAYQASKEEK